MDNNKNLKKIININDLGVVVYDKIENRDLKEVAVYIDFLHSEIKRYNIALNQLKIHLPESAE